jgi:hypothetical protein
MINPGRHLRRIILAGVLIGLSIMGTHTSPASAQAYSMGTIGLDLTSNFETIGVYAKFSGDGNGNSSATLEFKGPDGIWRRGMDLTVDRRSQIISWEDRDRTAHVVANPFASQWRGAILGLTPNRTYQVRVTFSDVDGVSGANPITGSITTRSDNFALGSGRTYYVSTSGSDGASGDISSPLRTIQNALGRVSTGDTVYVRGGTYRETLNMTRSGALGNYITLLNYQSETVVVEGGNTNTILTVSGASFFRIRGITFQNASNNGVYFTNGSSYNVIEYCTISDFGYADPDGGVRIGAQSNGNLIQYNTITSSRNSNPDYHRANGITNYGTAATYAGMGTVIRDNRIIGVNWGLGDGISSVADTYWYGGLYKDADVYNNETQGCRDDGLEIEGGNINVRVWNNKSHDNYNSAQSDSNVVVGPLFVFRNFFYHTVEVANKAGGDDPGYNGDVYYYHNTIYDVGQGLSEYGGPYRRNQHFMNNIVWARGCAIKVGNQSTSGGNTFDYDCVPMNAFYWNGDCGIADFRSRSGQEAHGFAADPLFVNAGADDFRLNSSSPAVNKGAVIIGFNDANSAWPFSGSAPDIGGIEFQSAAPPPPTYSAWDVNQDGSVNVLDLVSLGQHWGETGAAGWIREDVNKDGTVNTLDAVIVAQHWN